ncbi:MAG: ROK family protein [Nocardioides sp.]
MNSAGRARHIGVDIGGTKVMAGVVDEAGHVVRTARRTTPGRGVDVRLVEDVVAEAVIEVAAGEPIAAVGVAAAGFVDAGRSSVLFAPHLPWRGEDVRARLQRRWAAPVVLDNDANAAVWAEWTFGAARGAVTAVMVTLGTGIGGGLVLRGRLHRGRNGMAGEFGHMQVVPGGYACECGRAGCWEQYSSGNALMRQVRGSLGREKTILDGWVGDRPHQLTGTMVSQAALLGDQTALDAFATVGDWLGVGLATVVAAIDPDLVVVGGGVCAAGELLLEPARAALRRSLVGARHRAVPPVVAAALGPAAGLVGAATLARQRSGFAESGGRLTPERRPPRDHGEPAGSGRSGTRIP